MMVTLADIQQITSGHMDEIKALFKPGIKITVMVRTPGHPDRDFMMTDDDCPELIEMIERRAAAEGKR